jgi:phage baseplate assembly protein gpV
LQGSNININISGTATVNASKAIVNCPVNQINGNVTISGATVIQGGLSVSGGNGASVAGNLKTTGDVVAGTVSLQGHTHSGVQTGNGSTGKPNA